MAELTIKLDEASLREATAQAMLGVLTEETRTKILQAAIQQILQPVETGYGITRRKVSPLEQAFEQAVTNLTFAEARRMVDEDPTLKERMTALLRAAADRILASDQDKMSSTIAQAFAEALKREGENRR